MPELQLNRSELLRENQQGANFLLEITPRPLPSHPLRLGSKKSSTCANLQIGKPGNYFAIVKMCGKHLKKPQVLTKGSASLLKISLWDSFQFLFQFQFFRLQKLQ